MVHRVSFLASLVHGDLSHPHSEEDFKIRPISPADDEGDQGYENSNWS